MSSSIIPPDDEILEFNEENLPRIRLRMARKAALEIEAIRETDPEKALIGMLMLGQAAPMIFADLRTVAEQNSQPKKLTRSEAKRRELRYGRR